MQRHTHLLGDLQGAGAAGVGSQDEELLTAHAAGQVARPQLGAQHGAHGREDLVAAIVPVGVVDALQVVEVEEDRAQRRGGTARLRGHALERVVDGALADEHRADHLAADQQRLADRRGRELAADLALHDLLGGFTALVGAVEPNGHAAARLGCWSGSDSGLSGSSDRRLEPVGAVVAVERDRGAVGDAGLEVARDQPVRLGLALAHLQRLGEADLGGAERVLGLAGAGALVALLALAAARAHGQQPADDREQTADEQRHPDRHEGAGALLLAAVDLEPLLGAGVERARDSLS
jgi:hypothetical protein